MALTRRLGTREADINDRLGYFAAGMWVALLIGDMVVAGIVTALVLALIVFLIVLGGGLPGDP